MKNCLVVLGMHRSGTSAFTGILDLLGVNLGTKMLETQPDNPKGFFENKYVVLANDCILDTLKASWDDTFPLPKNWVNRFADSQLLDDIRTFMRDDLVDNQLSALKDPRLARLLPLWLPLFLDQHVTPHFAIVIRNPLEIAQSLAHRNGFSTEKSLLLWMQYMMEAERHTRHRPRGFVRFESLLHDPRQSVAQVFRNVGLELPHFSGHRDKELSQFLDRNMRHHEVSDAELEAQCPKILTGYYRLLCKITESGAATSKDLEFLDELYGLFESNQALFYNADVIQDKILSEDRSTPAWYSAEVDRIKQQFDTDSLFREYRYVANTEYLYEVKTKEVPLLQFRIEELDFHITELGTQISLRDARIKQLEDQITQFQGSPPWRVYKKYQETIETLFPEETLRRSALQYCKRLVVSMAGGGIDTPRHRVEEVLDPKLHSGLVTESSALLATPQEADGTQETLPWEPLAFPRAENPVVSIIIPVFNNWKLTYTCLQSVLAHTEGTYEVSVVDNHSTDLTPQLLDSIQGIRVITNETNEVFVNACNQAAMAATGAYLLFLNNDTEVSTGWLNAMLAPFADATTGIVGAKLIYPDGSLQEAGGIIWRDGTGCNYGHGDNPERPQYSYRRAVDYCSGACLMISRQLWELIGGFDQRYAPAYYEDTDLCFAARALNYKVVFQPAARVVHYGGASAGKETSSGYKRYQDINRHKFVEKWQEVLERDHVPSLEGVFNAREKTGDKHILIIDHYVPTFDRDSGSLRMLNMLQILQDMKYKVSFWPDDLSYDPRYTKTLQDLGIETYYGDINFEDFILEQGNNLDVVLMSRPATAKKYLHLVKKYSNAQTIFDTVDLHFVREQRRLELEVQQWKNLEFFLAEEADTTFVVSPTEQELLAGESFAHKVAVVSNIHSLEPCVKSFEDRHGLMFIGGFAHPPNEEGIVWFIEFILPLIRRKIPDIHLTIVGSDPTERILAMASSAITVTGYVEDVAGYFDDSRVFVSPLLHGAGIKGKIGQSFSYGLPVVTTSIGAEGMQLTDGHNALISDSETAFASKVIELYTEKFLWHKLSTNSRQVIREQFSTATVRSALEKVLWKSNSRSISKIRTPRPVIVHCHLFKNAGSTLDWSLQRQFGSQFIQHWDDESMRQGAPFLGPFIAGHGELSAISSHHVRLPLPISEEFQILPIIALRQPIDRARSVYDFERRQEADTPGASQAKKLCFADYVRWRMQSDVGPIIRNFHCAFCTSNSVGEIEEDAYLDSLALLTRTPQLVIVERYDESMVLLEHSLKQYFPQIDLSYVRQNETPGRAENLEQRVAAVFEDLGPELTAEFREKNHWDMKLYEDAQAIFVERLGSLGRIDSLLDNFRARCQRLLSDTVKE